MKYEVTGPRILVKVKKFKAKDLETFEGSFIVRADAMNEEAQLRETTNQTAGEVVALGQTAYIKSSLNPEGLAWCKVGDSVHFSRYGAIRLGVSHKDDEIEHWVIMDKDVLAIERA